MARLRATGSRDRAPACRTAHTARASADAASSGPRSRAGGHGTGSMPRGGRAPCGRVRACRRWSPRARPGAAPRRTPAPAPRRARGMPASPGGAPRRRRGLAARTSWGPPASAPPASAVQPPTPPWHKRSRSPAAERLPARDDVAHRGTRDPCVTGSIGGQESPKRWGGPWRRPRRRMSDRRAWARKLARQPPCGPEYMRRRGRRVAASHIGLAPQLLRRRPAATGRRFPARHSARSRAPGFAPAPRASATQRGRRARTPAA